MMTPTLNVKELSEIEPVTCPKLPGQHQKSELRLCATRLHIH